MENISGLTTTEAVARLAQDGFNEIPSQKPKSILALIKTVLSEPMILLLLSIGLIYLFLGEPKDSMVLFTSVLFVIGITLHQERKTESALQALRDLSSPKALVIRDGEAQRIPGKAVVVGDIVVLQEGDRVPADAVVVEAQTLMADESLLTGESLPVRKDVWDGKTEVKIGADNTAFVFSGTLVAQGSGTARVTKTGIQTEMGKIGKTLQTIEEGDSLLKKEISHLIKVIGLVGLVCCVSLFLVYFVVKGDFINGLLRGLTLAMSMLPEEFPVVLTIFLTLGAWRISKKKVLTRNNQAIETLGATTVLCVDKTGTLTHNRMTLTQLVTDREQVEVEKIGKTLSAGLQALLACAKLASKRGAFDPLEKEINAKYAALIAKGKNPIEDWHLVRSYNLSKDLFAITRVWQAPKHQGYVVSSKGAPEAILSLCAVSKTEQKQWLEQVAQLSAQGQRVLGVAEGTYTRSKLPESQRQFKLNFLGLVGFVDPLRPRVTKSMAECDRAGIRVMMITGDYPGTAQFIARQAGIKHTERIMTGAELETMNAAELKEKIRDINVFARVVPDQKLKIVEALKANGEVVAMTGDGVNDGPALKAAHIGIAMGEKGTDVARESADLVLLKDDFNSIVSAVKMGRRIYDNLQKAVSYIFTIHIPIAGLSLLPTFFDLPFLLFPIHIAFMELIIDPACSIVFETEPAEPEVMNRPPRRLTNPLFSRTHMLIGLLQGLVVTAVVMGIFVGALHLGKGEGTARFMAFITLILGNLFLIRVNMTKVAVFQKREFHRNKSLWVILAVTLVMLGAILFNSFLQDLFHFAALRGYELAAALGLAFGCYLGLELMKLWKFQRAAK